MAKFRVTVESTQIYSEEWEVEAETEEDAMLNWYDGEFIDSEFIDTIDSEAIEAEEVEE